MVVKDRWGVKAKPDLTPCGRIGPVIDKGTVTREAICNRPAGHLGQHQEADHQTFQRLAEWE